MITDGLTPVERYGDVWVKRDDYAYRDWRGELASGAKVRQMVRMAEAFPGAPLVVGCSSSSASQTYCADVAARLGRRCVVVVPARPKSGLRAETLWAQERGAEIVHPPTNSEGRARHSLGVCEGLAHRIARDNRGVHCDLIGHDAAVGAINSAMEQAANIPVDVRRVVAVVGSGATAVGIMRALRDRERLRFLFIAVGSLNGRTDDLEKEMRACGEIVDDLRADDVERRRARLIHHPLTYDREVREYLPDGSQLDGGFCGKAMPWFERGDCLWVSGRRPLAAMPNRLYVRSHGRYQLERPGRVELPWSWHGQEAIVR